MAENKNNRKSNRNFRLEKPVERHFDIEKETGATPVMPDNNNNVKQNSTHLQAKPVLESLQTNVTHSSGRHTGNSVPSKSPSGNDGGNEREGSSMKWVIIALIIMAIVACAYFFIGGNKDKEYTNKEIPQTEQNDSTQNSENASDSTANSVPQTEEAAPTSDVEPAATPESDKKGSGLSDSQTQTPAMSPAEANASTLGDIEENARRVIRGEFGNGKERKAKLGNSYSEIQNKVNEMYRQGLVK